MEQNAMRGGNEHKVAHYVEMGRVIKDLDAHAIATESLFNYLTDHLLANHLFGDDIQLEGFYQYHGKLHIITSQPFVNGVHVDFATLKKGLEAQGLRHDSPRSKIPSFIIDAGEAGEILVIDLHENNIVLGSSSGLMQPIDAHFYFDDRATRIATLRKLGVWEH